MKKETTINCATCTRGAVYDPVPFYTHENAMARMQTVNDRAHHLNVMLSALLMVCIAIAVVLGVRLYEAQQQLVEMEQDFETIETITTDYDVDQDASDGGRNLFVGGDYNGYTESTSNDDEN